MATGVLGAVDFSFGRFTVQGYRDAYAAGVRGFLSYDSPSSGKDWKPWEIECIHSLGDDAWAGTLYEVGAGDALAGWQRGVDHATDHLEKFAALQAGVGYKQKNKPGVCNAMDQDFGLSDYPAIVGYNQGWKHVLGSRASLGGYGKYLLLKYLKDHGYIDWRFLTYAWLYNHIPTRSDAAVYQYLNGQYRWGATVDLCQVNLTHPEKIGAWFRPGSPHDTDGVTEAPLTLLEYIMQLDPNSPEYKRFVSDIAKQSHDLTLDSLLNVLHYLGGGGNAGHGYGAFNQKEFPNLDGVLYRLAVRTVPKSDPQSTVPPKHGA